MSSPKDHPKDSPPRHYQRSLGESATRQLTGTLLAIDAADVQIPRVDVGRAAIHVLGLVDWIGQPKVRARFAAIGSGEFDVSLLDALPSAAWAAWHTATEAERLRAAGKEVKLPAALVAQAMALEGRMQACCEYYFSDDPELSGELAALRPGSGYRDLAGDLLGYARIYAVRHDVVSRDQKHYRAGDAAEATRLAETMLSALGDGLDPQARAATDLMARAWTHLHRVYSEIASAGRWLERRDPASAARYAKLYAAGRSEPGSARKSASAAGPSNGTAPAGTNGTTPHSG